MYVITKKHDYPLDKLDEDVHDSFSFEKVASNSVSYDQVECGNMVKCRCSDFMALGCFRNLRGVFTRATSAIMRAHKFWAKSDILLSSNKYLWGIKACMEWSTKQSRGWL